MFQLRLSARWFYTIFPLLIFCYLTVRAVCTGITYDEAWTLSGFVPYSFSDILRFEPCDANNHLLNTLSIKVLFQFLPDSLLVARLPNLFGGFLYLFFSAKLCRRYSNITGILCFSLLCLHPFLLEFFSLARGYGLALGLLTAALHYGRRFFETTQRKDLVLSSLFISLAVTAALSYLHVYLAFQTLLFFRILKADKTNRGLLFFIQAAFFTGLFILLVGPIQKLRANDNLYYGGSTGIYEDTLLSLASYFRSGPPAGAGVRLALTVFLLLFVFLFINAIRLGAFKKKAFVFLAGLFLLSLFSISSQFYLLHTLYVTDRTALFIYPLIIILFAESFAQLDSQRLQNTISIPLVTIYLLNFLLTFNTYKTSTWFFDAHSEELIRFIAKRENGKSVNLQHAWPLTKSLSYYREKQYPTLSTIYKSPQEAAKSRDYYIYLDAAIDQVDYAKGREVFNLLAKDTLLVFKSEGLYLFQLKERHD